MAPIGSVSTKPPADALLFGAGEQELSMGWVSTKSPTGALPSSLRHRRGLQRAGARNREVHQRPPGCSFGAVGSHILPRTLLPALVRMRTFQPFFRRTVSVPPSTRLVQRCWLRYFSVPFSNGLRRWLVLLLILDQVLATHVRRSVTEAPYVGSWCRVYHLRGLVAQSTFRSPLRCTSRCPVIRWCPRLP